MTLVKLSLRGLRQNLGRLILTGIAIAAGVGFVSGSFIIADSLRETFDNIVSQANEGIDARVQLADTEDGFGENTATIPDSLAADIEALPEVAEVSSTVISDDFAAFIALDDEGEPVEPNGPPVLAFSWTEADGGLELVEGALPGTDEVALDEDYVAALGVSVGDEIDFTTPTGPQTLPLAGIAKFDGSAGAYFVLFDFETAQRQFDKVGLVDQINVDAAVGVSEDEVVAAMTPVLPEGAEAISSAAAVEQDSEDFEFIINILGNILLAFAMVALFVSLFIIYNTFAILVSQRNQEIGMLRAIGATASQVRRSIVVESFIVGLLSSIVGLAAGVGVASLIKALFNQLGGFPETGTVIAPRTIVVALIVGVLATVLSAVGPAFRASRISPIAAMRNDPPPRRSLTRRIVFGSIVLGLGVVLLGLGLFVGGQSTSGVLTELAIGALLTFVGVAMLSVLFAAPIVQVLGAPVAAARGVVGRIARQNAARSPRRTAATATALMIGLALVTTVSVLGSSLKDSFIATLDNAVTADLFIYSEAGDQDSTVPGELADRLESVDGVAVVARFRGDEVRIDGDIEDLTGYEAPSGGDIIDIDLTEGSLEDLGSDALFVYRDEAEDRGLSVGDQVDVEFTDLETETLTVRGIYDDNSIFGSSLLVGLELFEEHVSDVSDAFVGATIAEGADLDVVKADVRAVTDGYSSIVAQDNEEFQSSLQSQIDQLLFLVNALLALALFVAFLGIINTIALSVLERTREIGLLRAVGMTRSQLKSAVRWEAVIVCIFGALLGIILGVVFAWAAIRAIPGEIISTVAVPWVTLIVIVVLTAVLGVAAAFFPARRAAKLDVLDAIGV